MKSKVVLVQLYIFVRKLKVIDHGEGDHQICIRSDIKFCLPTDAYK